MKYKIGDKVVIRSDLGLGIGGIETTIASFCGEKYYRIAADDELGLWTDNVIDHEATVKLNENITTATPTFLENAKEKDNYLKLKRIFYMAVEQAENGKGKERHANDEPFEKQKICSLNRQIGSNHGLIYQACKKAIESNRLPKERAIAEMLGAINYLAAAIILKEEEK